MPLLAILATATQVHVGADAAAVHHGKQGAGVGEGGVEAHVEAAVTVEEGGALAVALEALLVDEEHGDAGSVLAVEEDLLGHIVVALEVDLGLEEEVALARLQVILVDGTGEGVTGETVEDLLGVLLGAEADRAVSGQLDLADQLAVQVIQVGVARSILVIGEDELVVGHHSTGENGILLGDEFGASGGRQVLGIVGDDLALGGVLVGHDVDFAIIHADDAALILHAADQLHIVGIAVLEVLDVDVVALGIALPQEDVALVVAHAHLVEVQGLTLVLVLNVVLALRGTQLVVIHLLELVLGRLGILGGIIAAVEEAVTQPLRIGKLGPHDVVVEHTVLLEILDVDLVPVAAVAGDDVGQVATVVREVERLQGHGAVVAQCVGVEHHLVVAVGTVLIEHTLVLQSVVLVEVEFVLYLEGSRHLLVVGEFGDALLHILAEGDLGQIVLSHLVLGIDPGLGLGAAVILEPAVRVGHLGAEVVVHRVHAARVGVVDASLRREGRRCNQCAAHE